jgi:hypothetical protein
MFLYLRKVINVKLINLILLINDVINLMCNPATRFNSPTMILIMNTRDSPATIYMILIVNTRDSPATNPCITLS